MVEIIIIFWMHITDLTTINAYITSQVSMILLMAMATVGRVLVFFHHPVHVDRESINVRNKNIYTSFHELSTN